MRRVDPLVPPRLRVSNQEVYSAALRGERCTMLGLAGDAVHMPVERWSADADVSDNRVLDHCKGSTIDIGCGPGRMTVELALRGAQSLGIDLVAEAVGQARARGASAIVGDVFEQVPSEGEWDTALLADGNIGIGGDPVALLRRARGLVHSRGRVVVDLAPPGSGHVRMTLRLKVGELTSEPFAWSVVAPEALQAVAAEAGYRVRSVEQVGPRWFADLRVGRSRCR